MAYKENNPYQNPELSLETRLDDLLSRFTLEEKMALIAQYQAEVSRLGVNKYKQGTEAAYGIAWLGEATTFPQPIGFVSDAGRNDTSPQAGSTDESGQL